MDATEFTEKGQGATLDGLDARLRLQTDLEAPATRAARERAFDRLQYLHLGCRHSRLAPCLMSAESNILLRPGVPLTAADLDRIAQAEV